MKVQILPASLADKIAAGEVVERPASVVKELVENALDAGADNIAVEIKRGGVAFIRVTDNGCGMTPEDAKLAFLRHATSKISTVEDLSAIGTYGFRGEALAAISAVSRIELITCTDSASTAYYLQIDGGEVIQDDEIGAPVGTSIIVRNLFYNTPARLHFMKKDATETAAVETMIQRMAIVRHDVSFTLTVDGKVVLRTAKSDDMKNTIHAIYGTTVSNALLPVEHTYKNYRVTGYCCRPHLMRSNRNMQMLFLNGRYIRSGMISNSIEAAYTGCKETGKHPVCFLNFIADPQFFDINVHPAKLEAKFMDESAIFVLSKYAILTALDNQLPFDIALDPKRADEFRPKPSSDPVAAMLPPESFFTHSPTMNDVPPTGGKTNPEQQQLWDERIRHELDEVKATEQAELDAIEAERRRLKEKAESKETITLELLKKISHQRDHLEAKFDFDLEDVLREEALRNMGLAADDKDSGDGQFNWGNVPDNFRILGEIFKLYIIVEYSNALYLVDKHAAHEKLIYNQLRTELETANNIPVQRLLAPVVVPMTPEEVDAALTHSLEFYKAGFDFFDSGRDEITINCVPAVFNDTAYGEAFMELLEVICNKRTKVSDRHDKMLKTIACRAAIKGGSDCKLEELAPLVCDLVLSRDVNYCPHGRPVVCKFTRKEIDKMFKRIK